MKSHVRSLQQVQETKTPATWPGFPAEFPALGFRARRKSLLLQYPRQGSEHSPHFSANPHQALGDGAESGAVSTPSIIDPGLARIVAAWPALPEPIRRAMLALIETA
jgi:hypothetical protein